MKPKQPMKKLVGVMLLVSFVSVSGISLAQTYNSEASSVSGSVVIRDRNGREIDDYSNVVIFVEGVEIMPERDSTAIVPKISHAGKRYSPRVLAIQKKTLVDFFNDDDIYHNVFSLSQAKVFDLGIYPTGASRTVEFDQPGLIKIYCNIHPDMISNILVLNNNYFAVSDSNGNYSIEGIPDGEYVLRLWSEFSDEKSIQLSVKDGSKHIENFDIQQTKKLEQHNNKFGRPYRRKY